MASEETVTASITGPRHLSSRPRAGIVGGEGQMGRWFARFLSELDCATLVSDRATALDNRALAAQCDVVIVCVPIRATPAVLAEVADAAAHDSLVVSTASLMLPAVAPLHAARGAALCLHPLFGPAITSLHGQSLVSATIRPGPWISWLLGELAAAGAALRAMEPAQHDRAMASVQAMQHACFVAFANALAANDLPLSAALDVATPTFRLFLALAARILMQDPALYGDIVTLNRAAPAALANFATGLDAVRAAAVAGDAAAFERLFASARAYVDATPSGTGLVALAEQALLTLE